MCIPAILILCSLIAYPDFHDNPYLDETMKSRMEPYLLPLDHPAKWTLDVVFSQLRATENEDALLRAGFSIIAAMPKSRIIVAKHPAVPGYVFKLYYDSETYCKKGLANWEWLTNRCVGAANVRKVIESKNLCHFVVPDKWLYILPPSVASNEVNPQPIIVVETDMEIATTVETKFAWENFVNEEHLDELYEIVKDGYGSIGLVRNIHYTRSGKFAFIDTEYPVRNLNLEKAKNSLSEKMQAYWDTLIQ